MIFVDSKEASKSKRILEMLTNVLGQQVGIKNLEVGDYLLDGSEGMAVIERKTVTDLLSSLKPDESGRGRIWSQLDRFAEMNSFEKILIIEGWLGAIRKMTEWNEASVYRALESIQKGYEVVVIHTPDWKGTGAYVIAKYKSLSEKPEPRDIRLRVSSVSMTPEQQALYIVEGLPRVGPSLAKALLKAYGSVKNVFDSLASKPVELLRDEVAKFLGRKPPEVVIKNAKDVIMKEIKLEELEERKP
ncbi:MAG: ERCC4 domain-containing protein [Nitrososphaerota archaeon]